MRTSYKSYIWAKRLIEDIVNWDSVQRLKKEHEKKKLKEKEQRIRSSYHHSNGAAACNDDLEVYEHENLPQPWLKIYSQRRGH